MHSTYTALFSINISKVTPCSSWLTIQCKRGMTSWSAHFLNGCCNRSMKSYTKLQTNFKTVKKKIYIADNPERFFPHREKKRVFEKIYNASQRWNMIFKSILFYMLRVLCISLIVLAWRHDCPWIQGIYCPTTSLHLLSILALTSPFSFFRPDYFKFEPIIPAVIIRVSSRDWSNSLGRLARFPISSPCHYLTHPSKVPFVSSLLRRQSDFDWSSDVITAYY